MLLDAVRGQKTNQVIDFELEECCNCGIPFLMPSYHIKRLKGNPGETFYCPSGHPQHYTGKTEAQKLKEQLEKEKQEHENALKRLTDSLLDEINAKKKVQQLLKRVHKGVCPCCNRSFTNLQKHMQTKHADYANK